MKTYIYCYLLFCSVINFSVLAAECSDVFTDGAGSFHPNGEIGFAHNAAIVGGSGTLDVASIIQAPFTRSCLLFDCAASGQTTANLTLAAFQRPTSNRNITVNFNGFAALSSGDYNRIRGLTASSIEFAAGNYRINRLNMGFNSFLVLGAGEYWIDELIIGSFSQVLVPNNANVILHVRNMRLRGRVDFNTTGSAQNLIVAAYEGINIGYRSNLNGFLYARDYISMGYRSFVIGAINSSYMELYYGAEVTFDRNSAANANFPGLCEGGPPAVHHIRLTHDGQGLTCEAESINIKACTDASCNSLSNQPITVNLSPAGWVGGNTVTFTSQINRQLRISQSTQVNIAVNNQAFRCLNTTNNTSNCAIVFSDAELQFYGVNIGDDLPTQIAQTNFSNVNVRAVSNNQGVCEAAIQGVQSVDIGYRCLNPAQCKRSLAGSGRINLTFDANGRAALPALNYPDAGRISLTARATVDGSDLRGAAPVLVIPARLQLETGNGFPANPIAGNDYPLNISAKGSAGATLPNYQPGRLQLAVQRGVNDTYDGEYRFNANTGQSNNNVIFNDIGNLTFTEGERVVSDFYYAEGGQLRLRIRDNDYFSEVIPGDVLSLGDFIPAHFSVTANSPTLQNACNNFTYFGQAFGMNQNPTLNVVARNTLYNPNLHNETDVAYIVNNYDYSRITPDYQAQEKTGYPALQTLFSSPGLLRTNLANNAGLELQIDAPQVTYLKQPDARAPLHALLDIVFSANGLRDSTHANLCYKGNNVSCQPFTLADIGGVNLRYGRMYLDNAFGAETERLQVPLRVEYFNGDAWQTNSDDSCTAINWRSDGVNPALVLLPLGNNDITNLVGTISSSGLLVNGVASGVNDLLFGAPHQQGELLLELQPNPNLPDWADFLNIDWNEDGVIDANDKPAARVSFGLYRGNDRLIHWREVF